MGLIRSKLKKAFAILFLAGSGIEVVSGTITVYQVSGKTAATLFMVAATAFVFFAGRKTGVVPARK
ncbi:hypothetical protein [Rhizobium sp. BK176]|uniref:hypothetical protein n=1 Tax=Rhizobium sp. BK176 TaxID=2587071 RepID=UPI00216724F0|nr:hypothetical protein [Rhizobium sp. BK176]MCS4090159.1 hypothetical protein [Rhizobium sp. BK176]